MIPKDPVILLSYVNTLLRDRYGNLEELCRSEGVDQAGLEERLAGIGYAYDREHNQFR